MVSSSSVRQFLLVTAVMMRPMKKGQAGLGLLHRQFVGTGLTVSAPAFTSVNFRVSDGRIDAMDLALTIQEGDRILVTPTPVDSGTASSTDITVSGTVQTKSGKPITSAHIQVRFTKADGLCACKCPSRRLRLIGMESSACASPDSGSLNFARALQIFMCGA